MTTDILFLARNILRPLPFLGVDFPASGSALMNICGSLGVLGWPVGWSITWNMCFNNWFPSVTLMSGFLSPSLLDILCLIKDLSVPIGSAMSGSGGSVLFIWV